MFSAMMGLWAGLIEAPVRGELATVHVTEKGRGITRTVLFLWPV